MLHPVQLRETIFLAFFLAFEFLSGAVLLQARCFRVKTSRACRDIDARAGFCKSNRADALPSGVTLFR
jgi:hypothetical protein